MFTQIQLKTMHDLQNEMNSRVNPDWVNAKNDWTLAAMMEAVEAIDHHGWKWWKKQEPDMAQLQMELVDIWHFILSDNIEHSEETDHNVLAKDMETNIAEHYSSVNVSVKFDDVVYETSSMSLVQIFKLFVGLCAADRPHIPVFLTLVAKSGMTTGMLYKQYIGKNVLNNLRQIYGYKEGRYIKIWADGREDNEHLTEILNCTDDTDKDINEHVYSNLRLRYLLNF